MRSICIVILWLLLAGAPGAGFAAEAVGAAQTHEAAAQAAGHKKEHGLPPNAEEIGRIGAFPITNSMVVTWVVALGLIAFAQLATRNMKFVPAGAQNLLEWLVEGLYSFLEGIIGSELVKKTFWFFATIFIFILATNWFGLLPGIGSIGWGVKDASGFHLETPWFRGGQADLNMTMAMSMVFFACWTIWAVQVNGVVGVLKDLFAPKGDTTGLLKLLMIVVFFAVGFLEIISILFRPISLSFRLYGNIYAGENMLEAMTALVPALSWILPVPFYFMELLVGVVQAMVFMLLTAVFTMLICQHEEGHEKASH
jgi:F-type H+-transporting ATPase subunit a